MSLKQTILETPGMWIHCAFVGLVSVYDAWLVILLSEDILDHERNPIGRYLIRLQDGDVRLFVSFKLLSTGCVLFSLMWLIRHRRTIAVPVVRSLSVFQTWLLWFLTISVPEDPFLPISIKIMVFGIAGVCLWSYLPQHSRTATVRRLRMFLLKPRIQSLRRIHVTRPV